MYDASVYDASVYDASVYDASVYDASVYDAMAMVTQLECLMGAIDEVKLAHRAKSWPERPQT